MQPSEIEKRSLEAHVDLCAQRYMFLENRLNSIDHRFEKLEQGIDEIKKELKTIVDANINRWSSAQIALITILAGLVGFLLQRILFP